MKRHWLEILENASPVTIERFAFVNIFSYSSLPLTQTISGKIQYLEIFFPPMQPQRKHFAGWGRWRILNDDSPGCGGTAVPKSNQKHVKEFARRETELSTEVQMFLLWWDIIQNVLFLHESFSGQLRSSSLAHESWWLCTVTVRVGWNQSDAYSLWNKNSQYRLIKIYSYI